MEVTKINARSIEKRFHDIRTRLFLETKWFGVATLKLGDPTVLQQGDKLYSTIPTMAVDTKHLYINADFANTLTDEEFAFVVLHEVYHIMFRHLVRAKDIPSYNHELFNIAADYMVNWHLQNDIKTEVAAEKLCTVPSHALLLKDADGNLEDLEEVTLEQLYAKLLAEADQQPVPRGLSQSAVFSGGDGGQQSDSQGNSQQDEDNQGNSQQNGDNQGSAGSTQGQHSDDDNPDDFGFNDLFTPVNECGEDSMNSFAMDNFTESLIKDYSELCQGGAMYQLSKLFKVERIRWDKYLRKFLSQHTALEDSSFQTPDRHYIPYELVMPGPCPVDRFNNVGLFLDTSGSMTQEDVEFFLSTALDLCVSYKCTVSLYLWNTKVYKEFLDLTEADIPRLAKTIQFESGGTNYQRVTEYIQENCKHDVCYVVFTDGCFRTNFTVPNKIRKKTMFVLKYTDECDMLESLGKIVKFKR